MHREGWEEKVLRDTRTCYLRNWKVGAAISWGGGRETRQVPFENLLDTPVEVCVTGHWICEPAVTSPLWALVPGLPQGQHSTNAANPLGILADVMGPGYHTWA